ncbi:unnamed protein product [Miscanthus lutarioriparius]|uniref:Reverse transcriptase domain-containing protein n=1 Tax=Miscanthus lutarioriparius TaxID=422564 RepID=A0A811PWT9_9POAL|nr:unnamed protein product [Miscanthus lutarioriparius]
MLQKLIHKASTDGEICHPLAPGLPCPVLQYADDTLIFLKGDIAVVLNLRQILNAFSLATGLHINFHKSTFIPMNLKAAAASEMANILGCDISSFPQPYLGLHLSPHKLKVSDYQPLISSFDRYLAGWKSKLLSSGGRVILVNVVLSGLPIHYMLAILLPKTMREMIDSRRRAFLWSGGEKCHGSQCLNAWDRVCLAKNTGGLGVRILEDQNHCLLMKLVHKLLGPDTLPWKTWFQLHSPRDLWAGDPDSFLGHIVQEELPGFRRITSVLLGDGHSTSFWLDQWIGDHSLAVCFPALFSHCSRTLANVHDTLTAGLSSFLQPRLSQQATNELHILLDTVATTQLLHSPDQRRLLCSGLPPFTSRGAYQLLHADDVDLEGPKLIWSCRLPGKIKFFGWLLHFDRLNYRANLC